MSVGAARSQGGIVKHIQVTELALFAKITAEITDGADASFFTVNGLLVSANADMVTIISKGEVYHIDPGEITHVDGEPVEVIDD